MYASYAPITRFRGNELTLKQFLGLSHAVVRSESRGQEVLENFLVKKRIQKGRAANAALHERADDCRALRSSRHGPAPARHVFRESRGESKDCEAGYCDSAHRSQTILASTLSSRPEEWLRGLVAELFNDASDEWRLT
jgi:hypothetical protein